MKDNKAFDLEKALVITAGVFGVVLLIMIVFTILSSVLDLHRSFL